MQKRSLICLKSREYKFTDLSNSSKSRSTSKDSRRTVNKISKRKLSPIILSKKSPKLALKKNNLKKTSSKVSILLVLMILCKQILQELQLKAKDRSNEIKEHRYPTFQLTPKVKNAKYNTRLNELVELDRFLIGTSQSQCLLTNSQVLIGSIQGRKV